MNETTFENEWNLFRCNLKRIVDILTKEAVIHTEYNASSVKLKKQFKECFCSTSPPLYDEGLYRLIEYYNDSFHRLFINYQKSEKNESLRTETLDVMSDFPSFALEGVMKYNDFKR